MYLADELQQTMSHSKLPDLHIRTIYIFELIDMVVK